MAIDREKRRAYERSHALSEARLAAQKRYRKTAKCKASHRRYLDKVYADPVLLADHRARRLASVKRSQAKLKREQPEVYALRQRANGLRKQFGITLDDYDKMLSSQGGKCAICGKVPKEKRLTVDHCHEDGHIRGLLCPQCNAGIGLLQDSLANLDGAIRYLQERS